MYADASLNGGCQSGAVRYRITGPGLIDITIGSLDDPARVAPTFHYWESRRLPWLLIDDRLPRHAEFPPTT